MVNYDNPTNRDQTFGEKAVGRKFNPSGNENVDRLKRLYAEIIDILNEDRGTYRDERARLASVAISESQGSQMWGVKAVTFEREDKTEAK